MEHIPLAPQKPRRGRTLALLLMLTVAGVTAAVQFGLAPHNLRASLTPPAAPAATSYTLADIYTRVTTNEEATEGNHPFAPSGAPAQTMHSLMDIYDAIPTIDPSTVVAGTSYLGVAGTYEAGADLADMFNGTGQGFDGGTQANGGVDDYNNNGSAPNDRYEATWTQCDAGNNYCGTDDSGADAKDENTGLVWSMPCNGVGCSSFSDSSPLTYTWSSGGGNNNSQTAQELCSAGSHGQSGWSLPHQKQLMQAYINGSYGNLEAEGVFRYHWSATTQSNGTSGAWRMPLSNGYVFGSGKTSAHFVRCVRPAP